MPEQLQKILILGGTKEAAEMAMRLVKKGHDVTTSLAGRTKEPSPLAGKTRIGGFGGAKGLADYLITEKMNQLIDATHPFALQISKNAVEAAKLSGVSLKVHTRAPWKKQEDDQWIEVRSLEGARDIIPSGARVLLALGSQHIDVFKSCDQALFFVRMVDQPPTPLALPNHQLILGKPSLDWNEEARLLKTHEITHIVCRNSGGTGAYAKIEAARNLRLPVIIVTR